MTPETRQRIVYVEAEFADGERGFGTGFRILPGRILTSQHVVRRPSAAGTLEKAEKLTVAFDPLGDGEQSQVAPATELWIGDPEGGANDRNVLDAALLADELPVAGLGRFDALVREAAPSGRWETAGYVAASKNLRALRPDELSGEHGAIKEGERFLDLTVSRESPVDRKGRTLDWSGVSGAPVFLADGPRKGHLYGIVRLSPKEYRKTIYAVPLPALLRDADFRRHLGLDDHEASRERAVNRLRQLLRPREPLAKQVASIDDAWREAFDDEGIEGLLSTMEVEGELRQTVEGLLDIAVGFSPHGEKTGIFPEVASMVVTIVGGRSIPLLASDPASSQLTSMVSSPNFAEVGIARHDGRACDFKAIPGDSPRARIRAPLTEVEGGFGTKCREESMLRELEDHYLFEVMATPPYMYPDKVRRTARLPPAEKRERRKEILNLKLERLTKKYGAAPYVIADYVYRETLGQNATPFLNRLHELFPKLRQIDLQGDRSREDLEDDILEPLFQVLGLLPEED